MLFRLNPLMEHLSYGKMLSDGCSEGNVEWKNGENMNWRIFSVSGTNSSHEVNRNRNCSVTNILQNIFFCVTQIKVSQMGLEGHYSE